MKRRIGFALVLIAVIGAQSIVGLSPAEAGSCSRSVLGSYTHVSTCGELGWKYDPDSKTFSEGTRVTASDDPSGSLYRYILQTVCTANTGGARDTLCELAVSCPDLQGANGETLKATRWQALRARKAHGGVPEGPLLPVGKPVCVYRGRAVPMAAVVAAVRQELVKAVGRPRVSVAPPGGRTLVNLPVVYSAPVQHETTLQVRVPVPGAITADPSYGWDLGGGQRGSGPGHPYTPVVDPTGPDAGGYYVEGVYPRVGRQKATLTLTWSATIQLGGGPGALRVPLDPIVFTATSSIETVSATNRLYGQLPTPTPN